MLENHSVKSPSKPGGEDHGGRAGLQCDEIKEEREDRSDTFSWVKSICEREEGSSISCREGRRMPRRAT